MKHEWIVRASSMGKIMANGRTKDSIGAEFYKEVERMVLYNKFGIDKRIWTKYMEKGTLMEVEGIKMASRVLGWFDVNVNEKKPRLVNDWVIGECDVNTPTVLADIKTSWDGSTYPWFDEEFTNKDYYWQMQTYMWLTGKSQAELVYCLTDTPEHLIQAEMRRMCFQAYDRASVDPYLMDKTMDEIERKIEKEVRSQSMFSHIPEVYRVKRYIIERNDADIERMQERIALARNEYDQMIEILDSKKK